MPYGGGVLIGSVDDATDKTSVKFENCIFEDNTAMNGAAISTMPDAENVSLELVNCVVNNNTSEDTSVKPLENKNMYLQFALFCDMIWTR